jgi:hypothetical protein
VKIIFVLVISIRAVISVVRIISGWFNWSIIEVEEIIMNDDVVMFIDNRDINIIDAARIHQFLVEFVIHKMVIDIIIKWNFSIYLVTGLLWYLSRSGVIFLLEFLVLDLLHKPQMLIRLKRLMGRRLLSVLKQMVYTLLLIVLYLLSIVVILGSVYYLW